MPKNEVVPPVEEAIVAGPVEDEEVIVEVPEGRRPRGRRAAEEVEEVEVAVRHSANSWWCPNDDTAMPLDMEQCPVDGYPRPDFDA